jgi:hypothetical protein
LAKYVDNKYSREAKNRKKKMKLIKSNKGKLNESFEHNGIQNEIDVEAEMAARKKATTQSLFSKGRIQYLVPTEIMKQKNKFEISR